MISATDSYLSYITGVESTRNLWLLIVLGLVKIGGPWTAQVYVLYFPVTTTIYGEPYPVSTSILTLVGNFLNILHAGRGLNLSRNKRIKRINLRRSKKIGSRLKCPWHEKYFLLIWKAFQIQKNGVFPFEISFFVLEILTFFYYAN